MKKIICLIVFISLIFPAHSKETFENSPSGFYITPYVGYVFGSQKGINAGLDLGYKFSGGLFLSATGSYNTRLCKPEPRVSCFLGYEMAASQRILICMGVGTGAAFPQQNPVYPFMHYRLAIGVNVWKDVVTIYFGYDSKILFASSAFDESSFEHGVILNMRFLINENAVVKK